MVPENNLIKEGERVKKLRDAYAAEKFRKQQEEEARIKRQKDQANEIARIKALIKTNIVDGTVEAIQKMNLSIREHVNSMNLDNWDEKVKRFNVTPKLKEEVYQSFFSVPFDSNLIDRGIFTAIVNEIQSEFPFEKVNADYVQSALATIQMFKDDLPNKKADRDWETKGTEKKD